MHNWRSESPQRLAILSLAMLPGCKHSAPFECGVEAPPHREQPWSNPAAATRWAHRAPRLRIRLWCRSTTIRGLRFPARWSSFTGPAGVSFDPAAVLTDSSGQATTSVTLGTIAGRYQLSAVTPGKANSVSIDIVETALGYEQRVGSILADKYCSRCHDPESSPERVSNYDNLEVKPHPFSEGDTLNKMSDADLTSIILHGGPALNRSALMPPYGNTLSSCRCSGTHRLHSRNLRSPVSAARDGVCAQVVLNLCL